MTDAERRLWPYLRHFPLGGSHFRRQATIGPYFADFACHELRLVIEVDGGQHSEDAHKADDAVRTHFLNAHGYRVLRFWNNEVLGNIEGVLSVIQSTVSDTAVQHPPPPTPPHRASRGGRGDAPVAHASPQVDSEDPSTLGDRP